MALNIKKCKECGKIFQFMGKELCPDCLQKMDDWFVAIRDYLDEHPNARISELSEQLEIREKVILDFIKQGRIELREAVLRCVHCGRPIVTGDMCDDCRANIGGQLAVAVEAKRKLQEKFDTGVSINATGGMHSKK